MKNTYFVIILTATLLIFSDCRCEQTYAIREQIAEEYSPDANLLIRDEDNAKNTETPDRITRETTSEHSFEQSTPEEFQPDFQEKRNEPGNESIREFQVFIDEHKCRK